MNVGLLEHERVPAGVVADSVWYRSLSDAVQEEHPCDAHLLSYALEYSPGLIRFQRVSIRGKNRSTEEELDSVRVLLLAVDLDTEGHARWEDPQWAQNALYEAIQMATDVLALPTVGYTTRGGLRLIFALHRPLHRNEASAAAKSLVQALAPLNTIETPQGRLEVDEVSDQWTRLYRLPRVLRDGEKLQSEVLVSSSATLDVDELGFLENVDLIGTAARPSPRVPVSDDIPEEGAALEMAWGTDMLPTEVAAELRARTRKPLYDAVWDHTKTLPPGHRYTQLVKIVGGLCSVAKRTVGAVPEIIFGVLLPMTYQLDPDEDGISWSERSWQMIQSFYEGTLEVPKDAKERFIEGLRANYSNLEGVSEEELEEWVRTHIVITHGTSCYFLNSNGSFHATGADWATAVHRVIQDPILVKYSDYLWLNNENGERIPKIKSSAFREYWGTRALSVRATSQSTKLDMRNNGDTELPLRVHQIDPSLQPRFNPLVQEWLEALAGREEDGLPRLLEYLAAFPRTELPLAALWVYGPPDAGKNLLAGGLARLFGMSAPASQLSHNGFDGHLTLNPIVHFDEAVTADRGYGATLSEMLRRSVGHLQKNLNKKGATNYSADLRLRLIFTSNHTTNMLQVIQKEGTSLEDRKAISERFVVLHAKPGASISCARLVASLGNDPGVRLRAIAEHVLYLSQQFGEGLKENGFRFTVQPTQLSVGLFEDQARANPTMLAALQAVNTLLYAVMPTKVDRTSKRGESFAPLATDMVSNGYFVVTSDTLDNEVRTNLAGGQPGKIPKYGWVKNMEASWLSSARRIRVGTGRIRVRVIDLFQFCHDLSIYSEQNPPPDVVLDSMAAASPVEYAKLVERWPEQFSLA